MKMFVLIPSAEAFAGGSYPMVACDDAAFANCRGDLYEYSALIYSDEDRKAIDALKVGEKCYDGQGWHWWRVKDVLNTF